MNTIDLNDSPPPNNQMSNNNDNNNSDSSRDASLLSNQLNLHNTLLTDQQQQQFNNNITNNIFSTPTALSNFPTSAGASIPFSSNESNVLSTTNNITTASSGQHGTLLSSTKQNVQFSLPAELQTSQTSSNTPITTLSTPATNTASQIEIAVSDPHKVGEGMGSYMVYTVTTKTNLPYFRRQSMSVNRRFSDFLGLHDKLQDKHAHLGRIVPPPPAKSVVGTAKIKLSKQDDQQLSSSEFLEKRRSALERYLQRNAEHPVICADPDFREFLELETELPRSTSTSALSGAGVKRMFNFVSETVNKMTFKMDETDTVSKF